MHLDMGRGHAGDYILKIVEFRKKLMNFTICKFTSTLESFLDDALSVHL